MFNFDEALKFLDKHMEAIFSCPPQNRVLLLSDHEESMTDLQNRFTYHAPKNDQPARYEDIRKTGREFAEVVNAHCPDSRERSLAITKIEEAVMWANAAIARNE